MGQSNTKEAEMFTSMSITSLDQGKDLAHWHIRRLYGEPVDVDIDRSEAVAVPLVADAIPAKSEWRSLLAILSSWPHAARLAISPRRHRKGCEISAA
jgi:hypothetical protein